MFCYVVVELWDFVHNHRYFFHISHGNSSWLLNLILSEKVEFKLYVNYILYMILYFLLKNEHTDFSLLNMNGCGSDHEMKSIKKN